MADGKGDEWWTIYITSISASPQSHFVAGSRKLESISGHHSPSIPASIIDTEQDTIPCFQSSGSCRTDLTSLSVKVLFKGAPTTYHQHLSRSEVEAVQGSQNPKVASFLQNNTPTNIVTQPWVTKTLSYGGEFTIGIANCKCFAIRDPMQGSRATFNPDGRGWETENSGIMTP